MTIKYKISGSPWGLEGFYEGYNLLFLAGQIKPPGKLQKLLRPFGKKSAKNPKSIVSSVDLYSMFSKNAKDSWDRAYAICKKRKGASLGLEDIFLALLSSPSVKNLFKRMRVSTDAAEVLLKNYLKISPAPNEAKPVQEIPFEAFLLAMKLHNHKIGNLMLLGALLKVAPEDNILQAIFTNIGLDLGKLEILSAWILDLDYDLPQSSQGGKLLYCCRQARGLEDHFGYFFEFPAIETAVTLSSKQTLKDLEHKKALQFLVRAAGLAKAKGIKIISESLVKQAAT